MSDSLSTALAPPGRLGATRGQRPRGHQKTTTVWKQCPLWFPSATGAWYVHLFDNKEGSQCFQSLAPHFLIRPTQQSLSFSHNFRTLITWTLLHFNGQPVQVFALASPSSTVQQAALRRQSSPLSTPATPPSPNCSLIALWPNPCLVVPTPPSPTDAYLPYFSKIALLSEAELSRLLPLPPRNRSFPHACGYMPRSRHP